MPYSELDALAAAYGVPNDQSWSITVTFEGVPVVVEVELDSGRVVGVNLAMPTHPLPTVTLRAETDTDRKGKSRGINDEIQIGDPDFDRLVYLETDAPPDTVRALFADEKHRRAVRELLWGGTICLSAKGVRAGPFGTACFDPSMFRSTAVHLVALRSLPAVPVASGPDATNAARRGLREVVALSLLIPPMLLALLWTSFGYWPHSWKLPVLGAAAGLVAWALLRFVLARRIRGHSRAYRRYLAAVVVSFIALVGLGVAGAVLLNAGLDGAPPLDVRTRVVSTSRGESCTHAVVAPTADLPSLTLCFADEDHPIEAGDPVLVHAHRGFFGFTWGESAEAWSIDDESTK